MTTEIELLSAEQQKHPELERYIEEGGMFCPFCGSDELEFDALEFDGLNPSQIVTCGTCNREWDDEYKLANFYWKKKPDNDYRASDPIMSAPDNSLFDDVSGDGMDKGDIDG